MRVSSSLLLVLAAITMANAAVIDVVDKVVQPKHKLVRVKNGAAHVNALNTAKANVDTNKVDINNLELQDVAFISARSAVDVPALGAAHTSVKTVNLKQVAGVVHTLSASLESHNTEADSILKLKDHKVAVEKTHKLLGGIKSDLAHAVVDIHVLNKAAAKNKAAAHVSAARRGLVEGLHLAAVVGSVKAAHVSGATKLVSLLDGLKVDAVLQSDVVSVLADVDVLKAIHDVADVDTVLAAVLAVPAAVSLLENIQQLDDPLAFTEALVDIKSVSALVAAVPGGLNEIVKVEGATKLAAYVGKYGYSAVSRIFNTVGVDCVLNAVAAVPDSVQLLESLKSVVDVGAFVSGLHVLSVDALVTSIKAVADVTSLVGALDSAVGSIVNKRAEVLSGAGGAISGLASSGIDGFAGVSKRELLQGVDGTVSAVTSGVDLKGVLASVKRGLLQSVDTTVSDVTSDVDLKGVLASVKRELLQSVGGTVSDVSSDVDLKGVLSAVKRELLQSVDTTVSDITSDVGLKGVLAAVKRAELLSNLDGTVSGTLSGVTSTVGLEKVLSLKRALAHISALTDSDLVSIDQAVKRDVLGGLDLESVLDGVKLGLLKRSVQDLSAVVNTDDVDELVEGVLKREVVSGVLGASDVGSIAEGIATEGATGFAAATAFGAIGAVESLKRDTVVPVEQDFSLIDVNRVISLKRSGILSSVGGTVSDLDLASILPAVKRNILAADVSKPHTVDYTTLHARHTAGALLTESVHSLLGTTGTLLGKVVHITDHVHVDAVTKDVKTVVVPLVAVVGAMLDDSVSVKAPGVSKEVEKILVLAKKTVKSLP